MEEKPTTVPLIINALLSWLVSNNHLIDMLFSEYRLQMIIIAVLGAVVGTICAVKIRVVKYSAVRFIILGLAITGAIWYYTYLLELSGHKNWELAMAFFLILLIFGIACYVLTILEHLALAAFPGQNRRQPPTSR